MDYNIFDLGFSKQLLKTSYLTPLIQNDMEVSSYLKSDFFNATNPTNISSGNTVGNLIVTDGYLKSSNYLAGVSGWQLTPTSADLNISLSVDEIHIPDETTANSFHTDTDGNSWWGSIALADGKAKILNTGVATFTNVTISGGSNVKFISDTLDTESKEILKDFVFSPDDYSGAFKSGDITWNSATGAITGGSGIVMYKNGLIGAKEGVTTFSINASTGDATFAGTLSAAGGSLGVITTGLITLDSTGYIRGGATGYMTGTGFFMGYHSDVESTVDSYTSPFDDETYSGDTLYDDSASLSYTGAAQSFTCAENIHLTKAKFALAKIGSPTGTLTVKVYAHTGVYGTSSVPWPAYVLAESSTVIQAADLENYLTEKCSWYEFDFFGDSQFFMRAGEKYVVAIEFNQETGDSDNMVVVAIKDGTHSGNISKKRNDTGTWTASAYGGGAVTTIDCLFGIYGTTNKPGYLLSVGDPAGDHLDWDGERLNVSGEVASVKNYRTYAPWFDANINTRGWGLQCCTSKSARANDYAYAVYACGAPGTSYGGSVYGATSLSLRRYKKDANGDYTFDTVNKYWSVAGFTAERYLIYSILHYKEYVFVVMNHITQAGGEPAVDNYKLLRYDEDLTNETEITLDAGGGFGAAELATYRYLFSNDTYRRLDEPNEGAGNYDLFQFTTGAGSIITTLIDGDYESISYENTTALANVSRYVIGAEYGFYTLNTLEGTLRFFAWDLATEISSETYYLYGSTSPYGAHGIGSVSWVYNIIFGGFVFNQDRLLSVCNIRDNSDNSYFYSCLEFNPMIKKDIIT